MTCEHCGGLVTWRGPLTNLTYTQCEKCGGRNCQIAETPTENEENEERRTMKPEAQQIAIATACGWSNFEWAVLLFGSYTKGNKRWDNQEVPTYLTDLNACHEMEKVLTKEQWFHFNCYLFKALVPMDEGDNPDSDNMRHLVHATAAQRCEAFLKTLNLWKDEQ